MTERKTAGTTKRAKAQAQRKKAAAAAKRDKMLRAGAAKSHAKGQSMERDTQLSRSKNKGGKARSTGGQTSRTRGYPKNEGRGGFKPKRK